MKQKRLYTKRGVSLIDAIVGIAIFSLVFVAIFGVLRLSIVIITNSKARVGGIALANDAIEYARSIPYDDVGTVGGIPSGNLIQIENIDLNNITYTRRTLVQFFDAPQDGLGGSDSNGIITDYKKIKIEVTWQIKNETKSISSVSNIIPKGIETVAGGGTLTIDVTNATGVPVINARVDITNDSVNPPVSLSTFSDINGRVSFSGSPAGSDYEIVVSKTGYSGAQTYDSDAINVNPTPGHLVVSEGDTTNSTFQIDLVSTKTVHTFDTTLSPLANVPFTMTGGKTIGARSDDSSIYKYEENLVTDISGDLTVTNLEWDSYSIIINGASSGFDIAESCESQPRAIEPSSNITTNLILAPHTTNSLLVHVFDQNSVNIASSTIRLYRIPTDVTEESSSCGQAFLSGLTEGTVENGNAYSIDVSAVGYQSDTITDVDVSGQSSIDIVLISS